MSDDWAFLGVRQLAGQRVSFFARTGNQEVAYQWRLGEAAHAPEASERPLTLQELEEDLHRAGLGERVWGITAEWLQACRGAPGRAPGGVAYLDERLHRPSDDPAR